MTRVKKSLPSTKSVKPQKDLRAEFMALDPKEQECISYFFNLHNIAIHFYSSLSENARSYVDYCIQMSSEMSVESKESAQV